MRPLSIEEVVININQIVRIGRTKDITVSNVKKTYIELTSGTYVYTDISISELEDTINELLNGR
jgi:hypothetical protein